jgi:lysophospholipase L1-like esterase
LAGADDGFRYANLAIRGRLFERVVSDQLPPALAMRAELVSFAAGGNDALRRTFDGPRLLERFSEAVAAFRDGGADVVLFRFADVTRHLPGRRLILPRVHYLNSAVIDVAHQYGAHLIDLWGDDEFHNPALWSEDRLHLNGYGHQRVAAHVLRTLQGVDHADWWQSPPARPVRSWAHQRAADVRWATTHLVPWVKRRLTGRSSGDQVSAKRPELTALR